MADQKITHALSLALYPDGWKLHIVTNGSEGNTGTNQSAPLSIVASEQIARVIGDSVTGSDLHPTPFEVVRQGTGILKQNLRKQLQEAEQTAASIPGLRKMLGEVENQDG